MAKKAKIVIPGVGVVNFKFLEEPNKNKDTVEAVEEKGEELIMEFRFEKDEFENLKKFCNELNKLAENDIIKKNGMIAGIIVSKKEEK